jgi:integrase
VCDISSDLLWAWVNSPATGTRAADYPSENIRRLRRAAAVALYRTWFRLGVTERNLGASLPSLPHLPRVVSAFTEDAIQALKDAADYEVEDSAYEVGYARTPSCLALALIGAQPGEVGAIRVRDIDQLDKAVHLHGGGTRYRERWVPVDDDWAWQVILDRIAYLHRRYPGQPEALLAYLPNDPSPADDFKARSAATSMSLTKLIRLAGVSAPDGRTRVAGINEYVAGRIFAESGRIEAVAARLGLARLDVAAHLVGYQWQTAFNPDPRGQS